MNPASPRWISRKEIAFLIGRSYRSVAASERFLGLDLLRVRVNPRVVVFPRRKTLIILQHHKLIDHDSTPIH